MFLESVFIQCVLRKAVRRLLYHSLLSTSGLMRGLFKRLARYSGMGKPFRASSILGWNSRAHGSLPYREWARAYPRSSPGTPIQSGPAGKKQVTGVVQLKWGVKGVSSVLSQISFSPWGVSTNNTLNYHYIQRQVQFDLLGDQIWFTTRTDPPDTTSRRRYSRTNGRRRRNRISTFSQALQHITL